MFYVVKTGDKYVAGFNRSVSVVSRTDDVRHAKQFKSRKAAQKFIDTYSDAGYGFASATASPYAVFTQAEANA